jgi:CDP-diacylglycerol pyrophosphatase
MNAGLTHGTKQARFCSRLIVICALAIVAAICAYTVFPLLVADAAQRNLPPNTLWEVVHNLCVPGQSEYHDPKPCLQVNLTGGIERGFAILRDPRGGTHFLLIPTTRISGIESPIVRGLRAANYFADAWEVRTYINEALHQTLPRDAIGLAINSAVSRSQDQLHIHFSCMRGDILEALHKNEGRIGDHWALLPVPLFGHYYRAMWVTGEHLSPYNPFRLLAEGLPDVTREMGNRTLVVVGLTRSDGTRGFVILADQVNRETWDLALGEELLDPACHIVEKGIKSRGSPIEPGTE